jgi:methionyl-tRNA formyltransferase
VANIIVDNHIWQKEKVLDVSIKSGQECFFLSSPDELTANNVGRLKPQYIFLPHWSYIIPPEIYESYECVIFHMTDLPYGRGGSPLQNLIARGIYETQITAFRCVEELDAGPIYMKRPLSLYGTAQEIYIYANAIIEEMIVSIIKNRPEPYDQRGKSVVFKRRQNSDGDLAKLETLEQVHDFIRMLDADNYPRAFLETEYLRLEFSRSSIKVDHIFADVIIKKKPNEE